MFNATAEVNIKTKIDSGMVNDEKQERRYKQKHQTRQIEIVRFAVLVGRLIPSSWTAAI